LAFIFNDHLSFGANSFFSIKISQEAQCMPRTEYVYSFILLSIFLLVKKFGDTQDFLCHFLFPFFIAGAHSGFEAGVQVILHQHLMGGFQKPDDGQVLLHDIDAVFALFGHLNKIGQVRVGFFEIR
jgi:hypothetical protein